MDTKKIQSLIDQSLKNFHAKYLSFRSKIIGDTATDTYQLSNKNQGTGNFLPLSGGTLSDGANLSVGSSSGTKIGTSSSQKIAFYGATPVAQQTTGVSSATFVTNSGTAVNTGSTFDGYTLSQVIKALRNQGILQ